MNPSHEFILWIMVFGYAGHIVEEYTLDWQAWTKQAAGIEMPWENFFVINAAVIVFGGCCAMIGWQFPAVSLMFPALALINGLFFHIGPTLVQRRFSPGVITAVLFFLPIGLWAYAGARADNILTTPTTIISLVGGGLVMAYPLVLLKLRNSLTTKPTDPR